MIYMQVILDMNDILMFEDHFVLETCDFLIILLKKNNISNQLLESIRVQMHFSYFHFLTLGQI